MTGPFIVLSHTQSVLPEASASTNSGMMNLLDHNQSFKLLRLVSVSDQLERRLTFYIPSTNLESSVQDEYCRYSHHLFIPEAWAQHEHGRDSQSSHEERRRHSDLERDTIGQKCVANDVGGYCSRKNRSLEKKEDRMSGLP